MALYRHGASSEIESPCNHLSSQNKVVVPSPSCIEVEALNIATTIGSCVTGSCDHGRELSVFCSHSHLMRSAYPKISKLMMPNPPSSGGRHTLGQESVQHPPFAEALPFQRKERLILSMHLTTQGEMAMANEVWMGMAESLALISTVRPALLRSEAFQAGRQLATLSTKGCRSDFFNLFGASGMPK